MRTHLYETVSIPIRTLGYILVMGLLHCLEPCMNREDIIHMAREAGFYKDQPMYYDESMLEAFAKLISEYERKFYMQLFFDSENQPTQFGTATQEYREQEIQEAKRQERDACARLCEENANDLSEGDWDSACINCADHIRARGNT